MLARPGCLINQLRNTSMTLNTIAIKIPWAEKRTNKSIQELAYTQRKLGYLKMIKNNAK
jgi:hypothetical protein